VTHNPVRPAAYLPSQPRSPLGVLSRRLLIAIGIIVFVALVAYAGGDGYRDGDEQGISLLDALYYASVSVTTTGYGDITPVTDGARLTTTLLVTPARILFLILLVGTTVEVLAEGSRQAFRHRSWRKSLRNHTIVCGFGTKGRTAIETLLARGTPANRIVVVEHDQGMLDAATREGFATVHGTASRSAVLMAAGVEEAASVIVAVDTDETAVLATLTAREHNRTAKIVAAVREIENRHLLHESGADSVIITSGTAGRLLGFATDSPGIVEILEDLMSVGTGLDIVERAIPASQAGCSLAELTTDGPVMGVQRDGNLLRFDDPRASPVREGDRLVCLTSAPSRDTA
jgi:voltage-gated potassium channel